MPVPARVPPLIARVLVVSVPFRVKAPEVAVTEPAVPKPFQRAPVETSVPSICPVDPKLMMPFPETLTLPLIVPAPLKMPAPRTFTAVPEASEPSICKVPASTVVTPV